ncbi:MAG: hypothetical protein GFH25_541284n11 [Chloroflexi bacterium AL-N10]|nr:hypothetical protein [Chloroflexi bacterium AL-N10]
MTSIKRTFRWFAIILSILLFGALIIPFATRMSQANEQTMTLTPGDTLTINCDTELDTDIQGNQVSLKCAPLPAEPIATGFDGLTNGQSVSGMVNVEALTEGENIHQVKFTLQGPKEIEHVEYHAPFFLFGDSNGNPKGWDTTEYPDGEYRLIARATNEQGQGKSTTIVVRIDNGTQTAPADSETDAPITVSAQESPVNNNGKIMVIPGRIEAEHYRKGGQNTGYLDKSRGNQGDSNYRNDDVDIRNCDSNGDGQKKERCVGWWEGDEWLAYQVDIQASGKYVFRVRGAADHNNAKLELRIGDNKVGEVRLRDTGSAAKFDISTSDQIQLPEGRHLLRIKQASGHSFDIDAINVERAGGSEPQPTQAPPRDDSRLVQIPGTFEVENYRDGGRDQGYYDKSRGNKGDSNYRNDDVDIRNCGGDEDGRCVGWWEGDEWLAYNVDIQASGKYTFRVRGATSRDDAKIQFRIDDTAIGSVTLKNTGGANSFATSTSEAIQLPKGRHTLKIKQVGGHSFDLNAINVERAGGSEPQPTQAPPRDDSRLVQIPGTFEVENYRDGGRDQGYYDKSRGNKGDSNYRNDDVDIRNCGGDEDGRCVGWWEGDEWLAYNVDIQASGKYTFRVRGATSRDDAKIQFRIDDTAIGSVTLKNTGGANSFATSTSEAIQLPKGRHTLKIKQVGGHSFDLNAINVERAGDGGGNPPAPTNEPQPTNEPVPTNEPQPTNEPVPTNEPQPTNEPEPTVAPPPTDTGRSGRGEGANIYLNKQEIDSIREKVRSGQGPWQNYYDRLMDDARDALSAGPYSVTRNGVPDGEHSYFTEAPYCGWKRVDGKDPDCRDGQINPQANRADYDASIAVGRDVRTLGLAYVLSGEERYAERAAYLINVWAVNSDSRMNPRFTNGQSRIELSITMPGLFYGADLISESSSWSNNDQRAFRSWANDFVDSGKAWTGENNFEAWRLVFVASGAAYTNDRSDLNYVYDRFKAIMPEHIGSEGQMVKELGRTKSLMYSLYSLNAFTQIAEIARHNGENLYDYSRNGRNLKLALDYHVLYSINPDRWQRQQIAPIESKDVAHYEFAYRHYGDSDYLRVVNEWGRPLNEARTMGPVTLTHGR